MRKLLVLFGLAMACVGIARGDSLLITGAGSTFAFPLYSKWFSEYGRRHPDEKFNYQSIGSGGGVKQITAKTIDFGATDTPMTDAELQKAPGLVHIPSALGAIAVVLGGGVSGLHLTGDVLAEIYAGTITQWRDPKLVALNPGVALPEGAIVVAHRADGSGTTAVFTDYLSKVSPVWKTKVGAGKSVRWPVGLGAKGNEGMAGLVKSTPGSIGYVELAYAKQNQLPVAAIKNAEGEFVLPSVEGASAAAASATIPADFRVSITDAKGKQAYPISSFTYLLVYKDQPDAQKGAALVRFLWWAVHEGQAMTTPLDYAPLPRSVVTKVEATLRSLTAGGRGVLAGR